MVVLLRLGSRAKSEVQVSHKYWKISIQEKKKKPAGKEEDGHLTQQGQWVTDSAGMTRRNTTTWTLGVPLPGASPSWDLLPTVSLLKTSKLYNYQTRGLCPFPLSVQRHKILEVPAAASRTPHCWWGESGVPSSGWQSQGQKNFTADTEGNWRTVLWEQA